MCRSMADIYSTTAEIRRGKKKKKKKKKKRQEENIMPHLLRRAAISSCKVQQPNVIDVYMSAAVDAVVCSCSTVRTAPHAG